MFGELLCGTENPRRRRSVRGRYCALQVLQPADMLFLAGHDPLHVGSGTYIITGDSGQVGWGGKGWVRAQNWLWTLLACII